jgi:uncharacterized protein with NRDE domain
LIVAANREEAYDRPTAAAAFWDDAPNVLAGRDLLQGGTWLGVTRQGRFAALTNFRSVEANRSDGPSRGGLVSEFLRGNQTPSDYLAGVVDNGRLYNGFSLIVGDGSEFRYYSNQEHQPRQLVSSLYGVSNHLLDTPWPKLVQGKQELNRLLLAANEPTPDQLFAILADSTMADDNELPDTGIGIDNERLLSPLFVNAGNYGTRSSTVVLIDKTGNVTFIERTFDHRPDRYSTASHQFVLE